MAFATLSWTANGRLTPRLGLSIVMSGVAEEVSDSAKTIVEISAAERVIIARSCELAKVESIECKK